MTHCCSVVFFLFLPLSDFSFPFTPLPNSGVILLELLSLALEMKHHPFHPPWGGMGDTAMLPLGSHQRKTTPTTSGYTLQAEAGDLLPGADQFICFLMSPRDESVCYFFQLWIPVADFQAK